MRVKELHEQKDIEHSLRKEKEKERKQTPAEILSQNWKEPATQSKRSPWYKPKTRSTKAWR